MTSSAAGITSLPMPSPGTTAIRLDITEDYTKTAGSPRRTRRRGENNCRRNGRFIQETQDGRGGNIAAASRQTPFFPPRLRASAVSPLFPLIYNQTFYIQENTCLSKRTLINCAG